DISGKTGNFAAGGVLPEFIISGIAVVGTVLRHPDLVLIVDQVGGQTVVQHVPIGIEHRLVFRIGDDLEKSQGVAGQLGFLRAGRPAVVGVGQPSGKFVVHDYRHIQLAPVKKLQHIFRFFLRFAGGRGHGVIIYADHDSRVTGSLIV